MSSIFIIGPLGARKTIRLMFMLSSSKKFSIIFWFFWRGLGSMIETKLAMKTSDHEYGMLSGYVRKYSRCSSRLSKTI